MVFNNTLMVHNILVTGKIIKLREKVNYFIPTMTYMKETSKITSVMAMVHISFQLMVQPMKENGKTISIMEMVNKSGMMVQFLLDSSKTENRMDMDLYNGLIKISIMVNGRII